MLEDMERNSRRSGNGQKGKTIDKKRHKKEVHDSLLNENSKTGYFSMEAIMEFFKSTTDVKFRRFAKYAKDLIQTNILKSAVEQKQMVLVHQSWLQHRMIQAHMIAIKGEYVWDSNKTKPVTIEECMPQLVNRISRIYLHWKKK